MKCSPVTLRRNEKMKQNIYSKVLSAALTTLRWECKETGAGGKL